MSPAPRLPLLRSAVLPMAVTAGLLVLVLVIQLVVTHRSLARLAPLTAHLAAMQRLHEHLLELQLATPVRRENLPTHATRLAEPALEAELMSGQARQWLRDARSQLTGPEVEPDVALRRAIDLMHRALAEENRAHAAQLALIRDQALLERDLAAAALVILPLAGALVLWLRRRHFLQPIADLDRLLARMAQGDYAQAPGHDAAPELAPLFERYNRMVARLAELEAEHRQRQARLEEAVRAATRDLIAQNRQLAQADRLAAVGEMAAGLAHELRNPLAGIQLALANLRQEQTAAETTARLDAIIGEVKRLTGLMNGLLDQARLSPEADAPVDLARVAAELAALLRYQMPPGLALEIDVPAGLVCPLPENRLRQALLNLLLNALQALGEQGRGRLAARREAGRVALAVSDDGPGFPAHLLERGPRAFASGRPGGTGLGLASARRLARDLGGELQLENPEEGGARATLVLPCAASTP